MALASVVTASVRPDRFDVYEEIVRRVVDRAKRANDPAHWHVQQVTFGEAGRYHFLQELSDWEALGRIDRTDDVVLRLFGEAEGRPLLASLRECLLGSRRTVSRERPDLGTGHLDGALPTATCLVTILRVHPGGGPRCEELIRRTAEAIARVGDPSRLHVYETLIGDGRSYWTVRPIEEMSALAEVLPPRDLLLKAFGDDEGLRIYRTGLEAVEQVDRQLTVLRPDLSRLD
jgi:hypothetical protein